MQEERDTDLTIELFNFCRGTCTGCMLSAQERRESNPSLGINDFTLAMQRLRTYAQAKDLKFRAVLTFGDVIWMPLGTLEKYLSAAADHGIRLGSTMTLVDDREEHYQKAIELLKRYDSSCVFDITIDPVRLERNSRYRERIKSAIQSAPHCHTQVLLSEAVIQNYQPEALSNLIVESTGGTSAILGFAASLSNISHRNYRYNIKSAAEYAQKYYNGTPQSQKLMQADILRFHHDSNGSYSDFLRQTLHIGNDLNIYPNAYTIFGDVIFDQRNASRAIANIRNLELEEALSSVRLMSMSAINGTQMSTDKTFGCSGCEFLNACTYNGVGMARKIYSDFEIKAGACYGPKTLLEPPKSSLQQSER